MEKLQKYEVNATQLFRESDTAVLSTISESSDSYPFGSFTTYSSNINRELIIYASDLAEHTKNILSDTRSCVTIFSLASGSDKQASSRLSLIGDFSKVEANDHDKYANRFVKFLPKSAAYSLMHGFNFYKLSIIKARWIGGFGEIAWLDTTNWISQIPKWAKNEQLMIDHMNQDHKNVVISALHKNFSIKDKKAEIFSMCIDGYYITSNKKTYFIPFAMPCHTEKAIRSELIKQANDNRSFEL